MKIFYQKDNKHLIVVPSRNGTTHLYNNMQRYDILDVTYEPMFNSIIDDVQKKTFIYRDPCLRLISFYNKFIYQPYSTSVIEKKSMKIEKINVGIVDKFKPTIRGDDCLSDLLFAKNNIKKNYVADTHTEPQYLFFQNKQYNQNMKDYEIISVEQYVKWLRLTFADFHITKNTSDIDKISISPNSFRKMQIIQELCLSLYKDDYKILEPRIVYI